MRSKVKYDKLNSAQLIKAIETEFKKMPGKLMNQKDADLVKKVVVSNAKTGNTGFVFDKTYSKKYQTLKKKKGLRSKFYSPANGNHTLDFVRGKFSFKGVAGRITIFIPNALARQKEYWHRMGLAGNSSKIRQWFGINTELENRIIRTFAKRLIKLTKRR